MSRTEREAVYKVSVEKDGNGFREVEDEIKGAAEAAGDADESFEDLFSDLQDQLKEGRLDWEKFKDLVQSALPDDIDIDWSSFAPDDVVIQKLESAENAMAGFEEAVEKGGDELKQFAVRARRDLDAAKKASEDLKASGVGLTDAHEEELEELEAQYQETMKAAGEFLAQQSEVERQLTRSQAQAGDYGAEIGSLEDALASLSPAMAKTVARIGALSAGFAAGYDAGTAFVGLLGQIDEALNTKLLASLNEAVTDKFWLQELSDWWFDVAPSVEEEAQQLEHVLKQLRAEGLEPQGETLEELRAQLEKYRQEQGEVARSTAELNRRTQEWVKSLDLAADEVSKSGKRLGDVLGNLITNESFNFDKIDFGAFVERVGPQLSEALSNIKVSGVEPPEGLAEAVDEMFFKLEEYLSDSADRLDPRAFEKTVKKPIQAFIDSLQNAPNEIREHAEEIAAAFNILPSELEAKLERIEGLEDRYSTAWKNLLKMPEDVDRPDEHVEAIARSLEGLAERIQQASGEMTDLSGAEADAFRQSITEQIELYQSLGGAHTETIDVISANLGLMIQPWEDTAQGARTAQEAIDQARHSAEQLGSGTQSGAQGLREMGAAASEMADSSDQAAIRMETVQQKIDGQTQTITRFTNVTDGASAASRDLASAQGESAAAAERDAEAQNRAGNAKGQHTDATRGLGQAQNDLDLDSANQGLENQAESSRKAGQGFGEMAEKARSAAESQREIVERNEELMASLESVEAGLGETVDQIAELPTKLKESFGVITTEVGKLPETVKTAVSASVKHFDPLLTKLKEIQAALQKTQSDIEATRKMGEEL